MGRHYTKDTTDIYRQKVTRRGMTIPSRWDTSPEEPHPYEKVEFYGPYRSTNVGGNPWINKGDAEVIVEIQKLSVVNGELGWVTEKKRVLTNS